LILLPAALALSALLPQVIMPLLMLGGIYLCYEGAEKLFAPLLGHAPHEHGHGSEAAGDGALAVAPAVPDDQALENAARPFEDEKVNGAIKTDFILSA